MFSITKHQGNEIKKKTCDVIPSHFGRQKAHTHH